MVFSHVEGLQLQHVEPVDWQPAGLPAGLRLQTLGHDDASGALTGVVHLPAKWSVAGIEADANFEIYVLAGSLTIDGRDFRAGHYAFRYKGDRIGTMTTDEGAEVIARFEGEPRFHRASGGGFVSEASVARVDSWLEPWVDPLAASEPSEDYRSGVMVKLLRRDKETGATTHLAGLMPGWFMPGQEVHPVIEENYCLSGDVHVAEVAGKTGYTMVPGTYLARPAGIAHGPIVSKNGNVNLVFAHGPLGIDYVRHPDADALIRSHLEGFQWM